MTVKEPQWLLSGGYVHKMSLGNSISNITQSRQNFWDEYNKDVIANWLRLAANEGITMEEMNDFINQHWNLYNTTNYSDDGNAIKGEGVKSYQENYHNKYGFGNSDSFWNGFARLGTDPSKQTSDYRRAAGEQFVGDDYYGGQTHRRRATYFNADELAQANEAVKSRGWEFVADPNQTYNGEDGRKVYKLQQITNLPSKSSTNTTNGDQTQTLQSDNKLITQPIKLEFPEHTKPKKAKLNWSDWIPLTAQLTGDLITNSYMSQLQKKMRFPLREAPFLQHKITNDYYARTQLGLAAGEARGRAATLNLTSDIDLNLRIRDAAEKHAGLYESQAAQLKANTFARESQLAEETRNKNILAGVETANYNRQQNAAAWNNILNANQLQAAKNLQSVNSYIGNMYQSFGEALKTKRLNELNYQLATNQYEANKKAAAARQAYYNATSDVLNWNEIGSAFDELASGRQEADWNAYFKDGKWQKNWKDQMTIGKGLDAKQQLQIRNWLNNSLSDFAKTWRAKWEGYQKQALTNYYNLLAGISDWLAAKNLDVPAFIDNLWDLTGWHKPKASRVNPLWRTASYSKNGGTLLARNGSKLSEFTRLYLKELQHVRRSQDERNKTSLKHLDKQLERLNREQILLLRSAFK